MMSSTDVKIRPARAADAAWIVPLTPRLHGCAASTWHGASVTRGPTESTSIPRHSRPSKLTVDELRSRSIGW